MRINNIIILTVIITIMPSCKKTIQQRALNFDVVSKNNARQPSSNFKVGDTVNFVFSGNPDHITFYSGEIGKKYQYISRISEPSSTKDTLNFSTAMNTAGTGSLQLLISTTYDSYTQINATDSTNIISSYPTRWTDLTSKANWATNATATKSGAISLGDYAATGKPVFLAFRYRTEAGVSQPKWTISNMSVRHYLADTSYVIDSSNVFLPTTFPAFAVSPGWGTVNVLNPVIKFVPNGGGSGNKVLSPASNASTTGFTITGNVNAATSVPTESWLISGPIDLSRVLPDNGVAIKGMTSNASTTLYGGSIASSWANYSYIFKRPGIYNVVFLASTSTKDGQSSLIKIIRITVNKYS